LAGGTGDGDCHVIDGGVGGTEGFNAVVETGGAGEEDVEEVGSLFLGGECEGLLADLGVDAVAFGELEEEDGELVWGKEGREGGSEGGTSGCGLPETRRS